MSSTFQTNPKSIGLKEDYLYEVLATTFSINDNNIIPNTACMGIRLIDNSSIKLRPYPNTSTYENLRSNKLITLNFVDDIYLYALASLKDLKRSKNIKIFPEEFYDYYKIKNKKIKEVFTNHSNSEMVSLPYIKKAWAMIACVAMGEEQIVKNDDLGELRVIEFTLSILSCDKFKESFKIFNRAENIALETIILATKLKVAEEKKDKALVQKIEQKIEESFAEIQRFGKNLSALKAVEHVKDYIKNLKD
ncbi:MAG: hypothetical protein CEE42_10005 [Promethearchaeota archaeon Loki_b31]|nr:MAG: hypothetical protein CEE42_10005 [Candidatus Lokiarchaeota archaeon Loki_b31]